MNIIIVGCGKVGQALSDRLVEEGHNITVVDIDEDNVSATVNKRDVRGVTGNGATFSVQQEAGIENAHILIAVTGSDEMNLLCCMIAKKAGNDCRTVARIRKPEYWAEENYLKEEVGLALMINSDYSAAEEVSRILSFTSAIKIETFAGGKVELMKFRLPADCRIIGKNVRQISGEINCDILFCTAERDDEVHVVKGDFVFMEKDVVSIIAQPKNAAEFFRKIGFKAEAVKDVILVGGGGITRYLCESLPKMGIRVKVIEKDAAVCDAISTAYPGVTVICGDASDKDLLMEEGLDDADAFVALTNMDEENILLSLFARSEGKAKVITKVTRIDFDKVIAKLDLDTILFPRSIISEEIARYVRATKNTMGSNVKALYSIIEGKVEAAEFSVCGNSPIVGVPISDLKLKPGILIASIVRGDRIITPRGFVQIQADDAVVVVSGGEALHDINDILD